MHLTSQLLKRATLRTFSARIDERLLKCHVVKWDYAFRLAELYGFGILHNFGFQELYKEHDVNGRIHAIIFSASPSL